MLAAISAMVLMTSLDASILYTTLPRLAAVFHTKSSTVGWLNIVYYIVNLSLTLTLAKIGDALGRKRILLFGLAFYTFGLALASVSSSMIQLIAARGMQGVGGATAVALGTAITVAVFPPGERGKAVGILTGAGSAGLIVGPIVGGIILDLIDWRAVFYARVPVILACLIAIWLVVEEQRPTEKKAFNFDLLGRRHSFSGFRPFSSISVWAASGASASSRDIPFALCAVLFFCFFSS